MLKQASSPDPSDAAPRSALRVVLVKVGEEQLAAAGLSALTGQVHEHTIDKSNPNRNGSKYGELIHHTANHSNKHIQFHPYFDHWG